MRLSTTTCTHPEVIVLVVGHDDYDLVLMSEGRDELGDMPAASAILHDGQLVSYSFWARSDIYALYGDEYLALGWMANGLVVCGGGGWMAAVPFGVVLLLVVTEVDGFVDGRKRACT